MKIRRYRTFKEFARWGVRRRVNGAVEVTFGRTVFTTEPKGLSWREFMDSLDEEVKGE